MITVEMIVFVLLATMLTLGVIFSLLCIVMFFKHMDDWEITDEEIEE